VIVAGTPLALHVDARGIMDKHLRAVHGNIHLHHIGVLPTGHCLTTVHGYLRISDSSKTRF